MVRIGLVVFTTLWCTSSAATPSRFRYAPDAISAERLNYLLRKTGSLIRGPLTLPDIPQGASHVDDGLHPPVEESYNFYLPSYNYGYDEKPQSQKVILTEIAPPKLTNEPNYYSRKAKKYPKKYSSSLKHVNIKPVVENIYEPSTADVKPVDDNKNEPSINVQVVREEPSIVFDDEYFEGSVQMPVPTPAPYTQSIPTLHTISSKIEETNEPRSNSVSEVEKKFPNLPHSDGNARIEYQVHGYDGPKSYKFGYDTGKGKDRHFRFEERDNQGGVKGEYGYHDKDGKITVVRYTSSAERGFQVEKTQ